MIVFTKHKFFFFLMFVSVFSFAQEGTRNAASNGNSSTGKIMLIPFEPKLYMSEIDQKINQQTKWGFETIRENFRHQLDTQLKLKFQSIDPVISFYSDSAKMCKDLEYVYKSTNLSYDLVDKPTSAITVSEKKSGIKNGEIAVEVSDDKKFMNTKLTNTEALTYLNKKYKSEYFIFINELDIKNDMNSYNMAEDVYQREIVVHYSILDRAGKTVNAGVSTARFTSKENNPKKISSQCFSVIATNIANTFLAIAKPKTETSKK
jgi:hypothetical protein